LRRLNSAAAGVVRLAVGQQELTDMDKRMKKIASAYVDEAIADEEYRFTYQNTLGDRIDYFTTHLRLTISGIQLSLTIGKIRVGVNPLFLFQPNGSIMTFNTGADSIPFFVDTQTNGESDLMTVYAQTRRWVISQNVGRPIAPRARFRDRESTVIE
jgi:hypothetical protein